MIEPVMIHRVRARLAVVFGLLLFADAAFAQEAEPWRRRMSAFDSTASLQRGARLYFNYCSDATRSST